MISDKNLFSIKNDTTSQKDSSKKGNMINVNNISPPQSNAMNEQVKTMMPLKPLHDVSTPHLSCRNIYEHIETCPFCQKYYKQSNRTYILIIVFLVLIILLLLRQNSN